MRHRQPGGRAGFARGGLLVLVSIVAILATAAILSQAGKRRRTATPTAQDPMESGRAATRVMPSGADAAGVRPAGAHAPASDSAGDLAAGSRRRAMGLEAEAALGSIRTALSALRAETGAYNLRSDGSAIPASGTCRSLPGIAAGDLDGANWKQDCYTYSGLAPNAYSITARGVSSGPTAGITITLDAGGTFTRTGL